MFQFNQNPHILGDLARERQKELRREADAWRLAREATKGRRAPCVPEKPALMRLLMMLRLRLTGTPRTEFAACS